MNINIQCFFFIYQTEVCLLKSYILLQLTNWNIIFFLQCKVNNKSLSLLLVSLAIPYSGYHLYFPHKSIFDWMPFYIFLHSLIWYAPPTIFHKRPMENIFHKKVFDDFFSLLQNLHQFSFIFSPIITISISVRAGAASYYTHAKHYSELGMELVPSLLYIKYNRIYQYIQYNQQPTKYV